MRRNMQLHLRLSEEDYMIIRQRAKESGCRSVSDYIRRIAKEQLVINLDAKIFQSLNQQLSSISNSLNQIARRINSTGRVYDEDIAEMKAKINELWRKQLNVQSQIGKRSS